MAAARNGYRRKVAAFDAANARAAAILLADPGRYAGLPQEWARLFLARKGKETSCQPNLTKDAIASKSSTNMLPKAS